MKAKDLFLPNEISKQAAISLEIYCSEQFKSVKYRGLEGSSHFQELTKIDENFDVKFLKIRKNLLFYMEELDVAVLDVSGQLQVIDENLKVNVTGQLLLTLYFCHLITVRELKFPLKTYLNLFEDYLPLLKELSANWEPMKGNRGETISRCLSNLEFYIWDIREALNSLEKNEARRTPFNIPAAAQSNLNMKMLAKNLFDIVKLSEWNEQGDIGLLAKIGSLFGIGSQQLQPQIITKLRSLTDIQGRHPSFEEIVSCVKSYDEDIQSFPPMVRDFCRLLVELAKEHQGGTLTIEMAYQCINQFLAHHNCLLRFTVDQFKDPSAYRYGGRLLTPLKKSDPIPIITPTHR